MIRSLLPQRVRVVPHCFCMTVFGAVLLLATATASAVTVPICTLSYDEAVLPAGGVQITLHASCVGNFANGGTASFDWKDGSATDTVSVPPSDGSGVVTSPTHTYAITVPATIKPVFGITDSTGTGVTIQLTLNLGVDSVTGVPIVVVTVEPGIADVNVNDVVSFAATVTGTSDQAVTWSVNGVVGGDATVGTITGSDTSSGVYTAPAQVPKGGTVTIGAVSLANPIASFNALVRFFPTITTQPANQAVFAGQTATFSVVAAGATPLSYQWFENDQTVVGATSPTFTTPPTTLADNGSIFWVVVSNAAGTVTSNQATLTVTAIGPVITTQPANQTVVVGQTATFAVVATGTAPLSYQWSKNGQAIPGATSASFTTPPTTLADSGSTFSVVVSNAGGSVTSNRATLTVTAAPPTITVQPASQKVAEGQRATFAVVATGTAPLSYQWSRNGRAIGGATSSSFTTGPTALADNGATFSVIVKNVAGSVASIPATLSVAPLASPTLSFTGPSSSSPAEPQLLQLSLSQYPSALQPTLTLSFSPGALATSPSSGSTCDNSISLAGQAAPQPVCDTPFTVALPAISAGSAFSGTIPISVGSLAGEITVTLRLMTGNIDVTPSTGNVVRISIPASPPVIKSVVLTRNGGSMQVDIQGLSDTREVTSATFHFTAAAGDSLTASDFTLPVSPQFTTWFQDPNSAGDGGTFAYSQKFSVTGDSAKIVSVTVTLSNSAGRSNALTAQ